MWTLDKRARAQTLTLLVSRAVRRDHNRPAIASGPVRGVAQLLRAFGRWQTCPAAATQSETRRQRLWPGARSAASVTCRCETRLDRPHKRR